MALTILGAGDGLGVGKGMELVCSMGPMMIGCSRAGFGMSS